MKKDIKSLREFKITAVEYLAAKLQITINEAEELVRSLETEDMIKFEAPEYMDKPATALTVDNQLRKDNLGMTSHKTGNIIINTYLDWKSLAGTAVASVETIAGLASQNPILIVTGILSWLISRTNSSFTWIVLQ